MTAAEATERSRRAIEHTVAPLSTPFLLGIDTVHGTANRIERYNTALFTDRDGHVLGRYDKCHPVMFGEYVPFAERVSLALSTHAVGRRNRRRHRPAIGQDRQRCATPPNICYENTLPHLIRSQVVELRAEHAEPDVLVNLTNDGWFWGSSELDMHLACAVFRAVECRKPLLIAANTGFSAWIDSNGRIRAQGPRRATDVLDCRNRARQPPELVLGSRRSAGRRLPVGLRGLGDRRRERLAAQASRQSGGDRLSQRCQSRGLCYSAGRNCAGHPDP